MAKAKRDDEVGELYALPFDEFTPARDELAKKLKADGQADEAALVKKLKKPSRSAWAINHAVHADPAAAERLVAAGKKLEAAQNAAIGGKGADKLKGAMADQGDAVEEMLAAIREHSGDELSPTLVDRTRETLRAIAGDEDLQAEFAAGRLTKDREAVGFGGLSPATVVKPSQPRKKPAEETTKKREAEARVKKATRAFEAAEKRVTQMEKGRDRAQRTLDEAQDRLDEAEHARDEADTELADAKAELSEHS